MFTTTNTDTPKDWLALANHNFIFILVLSGSMRINVLSNQLPDSWAPLAPNKWHSIRHCALIMVRKILYNIKLRD